MTSGQCLMIKTQDHRKFFTHTENYPQLVEFSKVFHAEISVVTVRDAEVLDLSELAPAICDASFQPPTAPYEIVEVKYPTAARRHQILSLARKIQNEILRRFAAGGTVCPRQLRKKFPSVTRACLCNHLTRARQTLTAQGYCFKKVGWGKWACLGRPNSQSPSGL